jgi:hypothetical protein
MKSSAKKTAISFLAVAALGAAAFIGCKVDSTTSPDLSGDNNTPDTGTGTPHSDAATPDTGTGTPACETKQAAFEFPGQACLDEKCCDKLKTCFDITPTDGTVDCNTYSECYDNCSKSDAGADAGTACYEACEAAAGDEVKAAYKAIADCSDTNTCNP